MDRKLGSITVHSQTIQELDVYASEWLQRVDVAAPLLKNLRLNAIRGISDKFSVSFSAPLVEDLKWQCSCHSSTDIFGVKWRLEILTLRAQKNFGHCKLTKNRKSACLQPQHRSRVDVLWLYIQPSVRLLSFVSLLCALVKLDSYL